MNDERREKPTTPLSPDLILWRLEGLEDDMRQVKLTLADLLSSLKAYKAVMKFAVALGAAVGSGVAFVANLLFK